MAHLLPRERRMALGGRDLVAIQGVNEFKLRYSIGTAGGRPSYSDRFETYSFGEAGALEKATLGEPLLEA